MYRIAGIANPSAASATAAAHDLGNVRAFSSVKELVDSPEVDLIAITVKVPHHAELVRLALGAGKHVLCEWPLAEAEDLAALAACSGLVAAVGLQAVFAPAIDGLAEIMESGVLGSILSSTLVGYGMTWGREIEQRNAYLLDATNGATTLTLAIGHALSAVEAALGRITAVSGQISSRHSLCNGQLTDLERL